MPKSILSILLFVVGFVIIYFGLYQGTILMLNSAGELSEKKIALGDWEAKQDLVRQLEEKIKTLTLREELNLAFPERPSTAELLKSIQAAAQESNISLTSFVSRVSEQPAAQEEGFYIGTFDLDLQASGDYEGLEKFIKKLEKIKRVLRLEGIALAKGEGEAIDASLNLAVYFLSSSL